MKRPNWKEAARQYRSGELNFYRDLLAVAEHLNPFSEENECGTCQLADVAKRVVEKLNVADTTPVVKKEGTRR